MSFNVITEIVIEIGLRLGSNRLENPFGFREFNRINYELLRRFTESYRENKRYLGIIIINLENCYDRFIQASYVVALD